MAIKIRKSNHLTPQEFCSKYLPPTWSERDLQTYIQKVLARKRLGLMPRDEVAIATPHSRRRADISTWSTVYEVKCWLTYDNIYHAIAQTELYTRYGDNMFLFIPKSRVVIGVAPYDYKEYESASRLAKDFSNLAGIKVIFINECHEWHLSGKNDTATNQLLLMIIGLLVLFIVSFVVVTLIR